MVREAARRPTATFLKMLASTGCSLHVTTISYIFHIPGLQGWVVRWKPFSIILLLCVCVSVSSIFQHFPCVLSSVQLVKSLLNFYSIRVYLQSLSPLVKIIKIWFYAEYISEITENFNFKC